MTVSGAQQNQDNADERDSRLRFFKKLQAVTNKIHSTSNADQIMHDLSQDICELFDCDRFTLYAMSDDHVSIVSRLKTGLNTFKDFKLPISDQSVAGYVALHRRVVSIRDVYDDTELGSHSPSLHFLREVDLRTGYRTRQMLVAPLIDVPGNALLGVVQLINHRAGGPFSTIAAEGIKELCITLAIALSQRLKPPPLIRSKYDFLIADAILSGPEFELATRSARRGGDDIEQVLVDEFHVRLPVLGAALGKFFGVPYEPFRADRIKPLDLLKNLKREFAEQNRWLLIEENQDGLVILALDPEQVKNSRVVNNVFPKARLLYRVTTNLEFRLTVDQFFGVVGDTG